MKWNPAIGKLQEVLAELYDMPADRDTFVGSVGLDEKSIELHAEALNAWHAILEEACKQEIVEEVVRQALAGPYGQNPDLLAAVNAYREAQKASKSCPSKANLPSTAAIPGSTESQVFESGGQVDDHGAQSKVPQPRLRQWIVSKWPLGVALVVVLLIAGTQVYPLLAVTPREQIEAAVRDVVERYQQGREYAQRTGDSSRLRDVLRGEALARQMELVNQTKAANCYWEIILVNPMTYEFLEIRGDDYVVVRVTKTETTRRYCNNRFVSEGSMENDTYAASYIVERLGSRWYITKRP